VIVPDDVAAWFYSRINVAAVTAVVSGGLFNGRVSETAASPYGLFTVSRDGNTEYTSQAELPKFTVNLGVMVDQATATQAQGVEVAVGLAIPVLYVGTTAMVRGGAGTVIGATPKECSADTTFPLRAKSDVVAAKFAWEVWVQGASSGV
jgi:hypothetical protein